MDAEQAIRALGGLSVEAAAGGAVRIAAAVIKRRMIFFMCVLS
jgi:hypothetical protein